MIHASKIVVLTMLGLFIMGCSDTSESEPEPERAPNAELLPAPTRPVAPALQSACLTAPEGVMTIERPMFPERAGSPTFGYSFKIFPGTDPAAPTVIFLPGGPGEASIAAERDESLVPPSYTLILTDPRGVGCNAPESVDQYPSEFYETEWCADDVLAIVETLGLDNYMLYGISYGTALATVTASRAEAQGITPPTALVLEGVLGRVFAANDEVEAAFQSEWRLVRDRLPEAVRLQLLATPLPLGLSAAEWGAGITTMLSLGTVQPPLPVAESLLLSLAPEATAEEQQTLHDTVVALAESSIDEFGLRLHREIACHELTETNFGTLALEGGELVPTDLYCTSEPLDRPYAARRWPVSVPIYYFSGSDDPNTPSWQAQVHYDAEVGAKRELVSIIAAGHNPVGLNLTDCAPALWEAMRAGTGFAEAVGTCAWPTQVSVAAAGE